MEVASSSLTVEGILELALPTGTKILAGREGLRREVRWVSVFRSIAPALGIEGPNELILLPLAASQALGRGQSLASILHELHGLKVSGVAVLGETTPADRATAELLAIPLLSFPSGVNLREIAQRVVSLISQQYLAWEEQVARICQEVARMANEGKGLRAILELLANRLGKMVAIQDESLRLHSYALSPGFPLNREEAKEFVIRVSPQPEGSWWEDNSSRSGICGPGGYSKYCVKAGEGAIGYLCALGEEGTISEFDKLLLRRVASICALELAKEKAAFLEG